MKEDLKFNKQIEFWSRRKREGTVNFDFMAILFKHFTGTSFLKLENLLYGRVKGHPCLSHKKRAQKYRLCQFQFHHLQ